MAKPRGFVLVLWHSTRAVFLGPLDGACPAQLLFTIFSMHTTLPRLFSPSTKRLHGASTAFSRCHRFTGFTLLELLVVIVIIGMLAAYVWPKYFAQLGKSEVTVARAQIESIGKALDTFRLDVGRYPTGEEGLSVLTSRPENAPGWNGPYLKKDVPKDPWGKSYIYSPKPESEDFQILSMGKDGKMGGTGDNADISN